MYTIGWVYVKDKSLHCKGHINTTLEHTVVAEGPHYCVLNTAEVNVKIALNTRLEVSIAVDTNTYKV